MKRKPTTELPQNFGISARVKNWAALNGYGQLEQHLEYFLLKVEACGYRYVSWDAALMTAIRDDWARLRVKKADFLQNIVERGRQSGVEPKIGESMEAYMRRVLNVRH